MCIVEYVNIELNFEMLHQELKRYTEHVRSQRVCEEEAAALGIQEAAVETSQEDDRGSEDQFFDLRYLVALCT